MAGFKTQVLVFLGLAYGCLTAEISLSQRDMSTEDQTSILNTHNNFRKGVTPVAANMMKMYWNADLARSAKELVDRCVWEHDENLPRRRSANIGLSVGQNIAKGYGDWAAVVTGWHSEVANFTYGETTEKTVGHYTQVVRGPSALVGCAYNDCNGMKFYACNYAVGNDQVKPYVKGSSSCEVCSDKCVDDKLCDCGNKMCKNGADTDFNTCSCTCNNGFTGDDCSICPKFDHSKFCGVSPNGYSVEDCEGSNVPPQCPVMCGFCPEVCPGKNANTCKNGGTLQDDCTCQCTSSWSGDTCETYVHVGPCTERSDCPLMGQHCKNPRFKEFMRKTCPKTCNYC